MFGYIVVISRNGSLGGRYPLTTTECLFGQSEPCDVRVHVSNVARRHCVITTSPDGKASIHNLNPVNTTLLNGRAIGAATCQLEHADVITVGERHFRWEYPCSDTDYPQVSPKMVYRMTGESSLARESACMVQVFKNNKPRHSAPSSTGVSKVSEPDPKRRKTIGREVDVTSENPSKPVNKRLLAVSQSSTNSRKSLQPLRVQLKPTSRRKSVIPVRTPNRARKNSNSASKSTSLLTKSSPKPTTPASPAKSKTPLKRKSALATPITIKISKQSNSPATISKSTTKTSTIIASSLLNARELKSLPSISRQSLGSTLPKAGKLEPKRRSLPIKTVLSTSLKKVFSKKALKSQRNSATLFNSSRNSPRKTPKAISSLKKYPTLGKTPKVQTSPTQSPSPRRGRPAKTPDIKGSSRKSSPDKSISPSRRVSPTKTPRGRPAKTPDVKGSSRKASPKKSPSPSRSISPAKNPRGRPAKTPDVKGSSRRESLQKSLSPSRSVSPTKTPRGRPAKTPDVKGSSRKASPKKSPSPSRSVSPTKTPRGRPAKTPDVKESSRKDSPKKSPSPSRSFSPAKKPRGRPAKTPDSKGSSRKASLKKSHSSSRSVSPAKKPRGRPAKTPDVNGTSRKASLEKSPSRSVSPTKTPRGRPAKTPDVKGSLRKASPKKSPSPSRSFSPAKKPRGRPAKTPDSKGSSRKASLKKSHSSSRSVSPTKTPRGRPAKTPDRKASSRKASPETSPSPRSVSPTKTPIGRPAKTPDVKGSSKKASPKKSPSPSRSVSPTKTPRGRPAKTPDVKGSSRKASPEKSPSLSRSVSPTKTPRGRPAKTPDVKGSSRKDSTEKSPPRSVSPAQTPKGAIVKTPEVSRNLSQVLTLSTSRNTSPTITLRGRTATTPNVNSLSINSSSSKSVQKSTTPRTFGVLHKSISVTSSMRSSEIKTPNVRQNRLPADRSVGRNIQPGIVDVSLLKTPTSSRSLRSESPAVFQSDKSSELPCNSSSEPVMRFTATLRPRHNRASILRTSLHHDYALLQEMAEMFSGGEGLSASESRFSTSAMGLSVTNTETSGLTSGPKRRNEDLEAEARAEQAAKRLKMETPKSLSKNKVAALLACHSRSPKSAPKRPLFSEVLKHQLTAAKQRQTAAHPANPVGLQRRPKQKIFQPSVEVPKSFKFNSTGHANSPETVVIKKPLRCTPALKTFTNRKQGNSFGASQESYKTPSKATVSSMKTASSVKKGQSMKVRFSLHNEVQSPSGKRVSIKQMESAGYLGSPIVPPKRYYGTPMRSRISETSMLHTSIKEESPLAQETSISKISSSGSSGRKSNTQTSALKKPARDSYDFSIYSPSSSTLQFSEISGVSSQFARKSIDFSDFSPVSESSDSPKRKRSMPSLNSTTVSTGRKFSFARKVVSNEKSSPSQFQPSPDNNARISSSDLFGSSFESSVSKSARASRISGSSVNTSGILKLSPNTSQSSVKSSRNTSRVLEESVSQIPLPPSPYIPTSIKSERTYSSSKSSGSVRSTRSSKGEAIDTPKSLRSRRSQSETLSLSDTKVVSESPQVKKRFSSLSDTKVVSESPQVKKRFSSTPNPKSSALSQSPSTSPILSTGKRSCRSQTGMESMDDPSSVPLEESSFSTRKSTGKKIKRNARMSTSSGSLQKTKASVTVVSDYESRTVTKSMDNPSSVPLEVSSFSSPKSTGKKGKKSTRLTAVSDSDFLSPESQVPILAVRPSTRNRQLNESVSSLSGSVRSGRSIDLAQTLLDSRASTSTDHSAGSSSSDLLHNLSVSPNSSRGRRPKSSSSTNSLSDVTTFDFSAAVTPKVPRNIFVSPIEENPDDLSNLSGMKRVLNPMANSPVSSYTNVRGLKRLLRTPQPQPSTSVKSYASVEGIKRLFKQSPVANYTDVSGLNLLYQLSTNETNYMNVKGVRRTPNSSDVAGMEVLFESPKKTVQTFINQSPQKPVGLVPPMSRSSSFVNVNDNVVAVDLTEPGLSSGSRSRRTDSQPEEMIPTSRSRKTRQTRANAPAVDEGVSNQSVEMNTRGAKGTKKVVKTVEPLTKGRTTRGRKQAEEDDPNVEIVEPINEVVSEGKVTKKGPAGSKRKLTVLDSTEPLKADANKRTRGRNVVTEDHVPEVVQTKTSKSKTSSKVQDKVSEPLKMAELPTKRGGRKLRGDRLSPLQQTNQSPKAMLGKRGQPLNIESTDSNSPHKKAKRGKLAKVEVVASTSNDMYVNSVPLEATVRKVVAALSPSGKGKHVTPKMTATTSRSRRGKSVTVSPVKVKTPSPIKPRGKTRKGKKDVTIETSEIVKVESPKQKRRGKGSKGEEISKSQEKSKSQPSIESNRRLRKTQTEAADSTEVSESSPVKGKGKKAQMRAETSKPDESTKTTRSTRGKTETVTKSPKRPIKQSPVKANPRGRRGRVEESRIQTEVPVAYETQKTVVSKTKGRQNQRDVPQAEKTTEAPTKTKQKGPNKTVVKEVKPKPETKKVSRRVKSEQSPEKRTKGRGRKKEDKPTKKSPVKVNKRLSDESFELTKPSTSRQAQSQLEEKQPAAKASRRVQFNTVCTTKQQENKTVKTTVKTKAAPKLKAATTRKSTSPKKPSPPKRVTRARK